MDRSDAVELSVSNLANGLEPPTEEQVVAYIRDPQSGPQVQAFLAAFPEYKAILFDLPEELQRIAETRTQELAREIYIRREAQAKPGDEMGDWVEAEKQLCRHVTRVMASLNHGSKGMQNSNQRPIKQASGV